MLLNFADNLPHVIIVKYLKVCLVVPFLLCRILDNFCFLGLTLSYTTILLVFQFFNLLCKLVN